MSEVERVLAAHRPTGRATDFETPRCSCGWLGHGWDAHVAEQIEALIAERVRAAQAEALREAAFATSKYDRARIWLLDRAAYIAQDAPPRTPVEAATRDAAELLGRIEGLEGLDPKRCGQPYYDRDGDRDHCSFPKGHAGSCW